MGGVIGGVIGGIGQIVAANRQAQAAERATQAAMTGYNYLTSGPGGSAMQEHIGAGTAAIGERNNALQGFGNTTNMQAQLLGAAPVQPGTQNAFNRYRDSTGYQFRLNEGQNAVTGSAAARGLLQSGSTARGLTELGQNMASAEFGNYFNQLGQVGTQQSNLAARYGEVAQAGQNALGQIGAAGGAAGQSAGNMMIQGGNAQAAGITGAAANFGNAATSAFNFFRQPQGQFPAAPAAPRTGGLY